MSIYFWSIAYATREDVVYGPFEVDLEKVTCWEDVFDFCRDELQKEYLKLAQIESEDADFVKLEWDDFNWNFNAGDHDDFFGNCYLSTGEYNWSKHNDLLEVYNTVRNVDDEMLEAIKVYLDEGCCPSSFGDAYCGRYRDGATFAKEFCLEMIEGLELPQFLVIDWEATWQEMHDYTEYGYGYIFRNI